MSTGTPAGNGPAAIGPNLIEQHAARDKQQGDEVGRLARSLRIELDAADYHAVRFSGYSPEAVAARENRNKAEESITAGGAELAQGDYTAAVAHLESALKIAQQTLGAKPEQRARDLLRALSDHLAYARSQAAHLPDYAGIAAMEKAAGITSLSSQIELAYNPLQPRDAHGKWMHTPGSGDWRDNPEPVTARPADPMPGLPSKRTRRVITAAEARGNSRPVSWEEFQHLAAIGNRQLDQMKRDHSPITGLDQHWPEIKAKTYVKVQDPWGGATIDAHTGQALETDADKYALSVKPKGMSTVSVPETASEAEFGAAMDRALSSFRPALERRGFHLGIFHDDDSNRIDIDPVAVVGSLAEVETLGAYTHAIGGAYHFRTGDGFWPPHVAEGPQMAGDQPVHFEGPGQWHSQADAIQDGEPDEDDDALASQLTVAPDGSITRQLET